MNNLRNLWITDCDRVGVVFPFRNILFPDDSSVNAEAALKYATAFAQHGSGRVVSLSGQDAKEIGQAAIDHDIDLITVATRDRNLLTRAFGRPLAGDRRRAAPARESTR